MISSFFRSSSILKKFLVFNLIVFLVLGIFTFLYLKAIKPNLVKNRSNQHSKIINNTSDHINRLNIKFTKETMTQFLLSNRFLFQNLDRVQFYDLVPNLLADTDTLDLAQNIAVLNQDVQETSIDKISEDINVDNSLTISKTVNFNTLNYIKKYSKDNNKNEKLVISETINNNFYVMTIKLVKPNNKRKGYIIVSEIANDILIAVEERNNFILRTVFFVALVIIIFSVFLNKYILKPIRSLVVYTKAIKEKDKKIDKHEKYLLRKDEVGQLSRSLTEMTENLYKRIDIAETFSSDLAHEIRNPLTSLKGASEVLENTQQNDKRKKLIKVISHDVERIERLITDYSQMLKDEAALSREKMKKINLKLIARSVVDDFNNIYESKRGIKIFLNDLNNQEEYFIHGIENRIEQIIANLLDNSISFSDDNKKILVEIYKSENKKIILKVVDEGKGFKETSTKKIFDRFYSNRPDNFGEHSGLGLNIVKNLVDLHGATIKASNNIAQRGANVEIEFPKI